MTRVAVEQLASARGCVLGLMLGDALRATGGTLPPSGLLRATSAGQLACFTVDGMIRSDVRDRMGDYRYPRIIWHAYHRWAAGQGIAGIERWQEHDWPDGWLAAVPVLAERRGSAPATVAALQRRVPGGLAGNNNTSTGAHALIRSLPAGLHGKCPQAAWAAAIAAASTHAAEAASAAALGAGIVANLVEKQELARAVDLAERACASDPQLSGELSLAPALALARSQPREAAVLTRLAPDARATSALTGGVYVAASFPRPEQVKEALLFAASAGDGGHAAAVAGAFLGTSHGFDALPVELVSRLELAWVADTLARDLVTELVDVPAGTGYTPATDPHWSDRYPCW
ncbi:ADP-ribosylglycohydrolase family protein [Micromonospora sp. IBHARD004]|uniref:ADP-ribosylglycohydrolase family protein n=1 Tax=Micromonospora sp. IBHARD004 TaxID=3457764 RepID=UPI0040588535